MLLPAWLLLLALAVAAAACQPLPHPFQPADKQVAPSHLRALVSNSLFLVRPLEGAAEPLAGSFAEALAVELQRREVPATARQLGGRQALAIAPVIAEAPPGDGLGPLRIDYLLVEASGRSRPVASDELSVPGAAFRDGDPALLASLAERGARRLVETVFRRAAPPAQPAAPQEPRARFFIFDVSGAPGDGNEALARAMKRILGASGVPFAPEMTGETFVLAGAVAMEPASQARERVFIDWTLFAPDGEEIGTVSVDNMVPEGSLDSRWGQVAAAATAGSAEGMLQLINAVLNSMPEGAPES